MGVSRWEWAIVSVIRLFPLKWEMNISLWLDNPLSIKHSPFRKLLANQPSILKDFRRANQTADGIQTLWALLRGTCSLYIMSVNTEDRSGAGHTWAMSRCLCLFTASLSVPRSVNPLITRRVRTMKRVFINEGPFGRGPLLLSGEQTLILWFMSSERFPKCWFTFRWIHPDKSLFIFLRTVAMTIRMETDR